jgi:hypothetical protein
MSDSALKFWLIDAVEHQKQHPSTFELPDEQNRCAVKEGEWAKLIFAFPTEPEHTFERMWVKIIAVRPTWYGVSLDNIPKTSGYVSIGDKFRFEPRHIISIWPPRHYTGPLLLRPPEEELNQSITDNGGAAPRRV